MVTETKVLFESNNLLVKSFCRLNDRCCRKAIRPERLCHNTCTLKPPPLPISPPPSGPNPGWSGQGVGRGALLWCIAPRCPLSKKALPKFVIILESACLTDLKNKNQNIKQFRLKFLKIEIKKF